MSFLNDIYSKSISETDKNIRFWEDYLNNLKSLNFSVYADKLKVPALVPIGSRIFFRGELKHTNEVTVALGADYFAKCSLQQAEVLRQHRIKDAQSKLDTFKTEREYLENRVSFSTQNVFEDQGQEIIEVYSEEEDKVWRNKHKEHIRDYKQKKAKNNSIEDSKDITDEELWNRLEELELQEELENEYPSSREGQDHNNTVEEPFYVNKEENDKVPPRIVEQPSSVKKKEETVTFTEDVTEKQTSKFDILQKVLDKQNELEEKLIELRHKERSHSKSEKDLISRLDEMEKLDELEDEMDRLDEILTEDIDSNEETLSLPSQTELKKGITFADEDESETLELTFSHSDVEPCKEPYNAEKGILKPSDIYKAYSNLFSFETTSILKKSKYENIDLMIEVPKVEKKPKTVVFSKAEDNVEVDRTIVVRNVVEKVNPIIKIENSGSRPSSLFKKRRQQMKS